MLEAETWTTYQRWVRNMKLEMYVGVVNLFPPRLHYVYFSLFSLLKCFKYSKMLMNIFRLRVLKRFHISSRPQMSTEKNKQKNNRLRKQDDETKADISLSFFGILLLTLVKLP